MNILRVALDVPLHEAFDFTSGDPQAGPGSLVVVPFGRSRKVGVVVETAERTEVPATKLKAIEKVVEDVAPLGPEELDLFRFCAAYYHKPLGEVIAASLPPRLRQPSRRRLAPPEAPSHDARFEQRHELNEAQRGAIEHVRRAGRAFSATLIHGVTGSGKTEVYLHLVADALARGEQSLLLVPEIGLTPQFEAQVRARFPGARIHAAHSHLPEGDRARTWLASQAGTAQIVLGTRLAVLLPFRNLGLIVVDEEHDASYKQQEGLRYSARDVAVRRAQRRGIPIVLGSATPSLETLANASQGRYGLVRLPSRAGLDAAMPKVRTVDTRADVPQEGLTSALLQALRDRLSKGEQSLLFLNRRGFSPVLFCRSCGWHSACSRCSVNLVLHRREGELRCHHCGQRARVPVACPGCGAADLAPVGHGTQRLEEALTSALPEARIARVDRDAAARKGSLAKLFEEVRAGRVDILVGTQMLAKGHDYPRLTLVGVIDADSALFSADFRAAERLHAQLVQVSGRAGRAERPGEVLIQTDFPHHPLYAAVASHEFERWAGDALDERRLLGFPPYAHLALLRAEAKKAGEPKAFLQEAARIARGLRTPVEVFDPVAAPLERKAGYERWQLLVRAPTRTDMQPFLARWRAALDARQERRVRWTLDVDPQET